MTRLDDLPYAPEHGFRGLGDLYLPARPEGAPAALVIHGGGWNAMDKQGLAGVAALLAEHGWGAYAINYRLLDQAPWPACGDDCLRGAQFLLEAGHAAMRPLDRSRLFVVGASAGGHLALMTGLRLPPARVRAIVSIAGPTDLALRMKALGPERYRKFLGVERDEEVTPEALRPACPVHLARPDSPPLLCIHSTCDELVPPEQSEAMAAAYRRAGAEAEVFLFKGNDKLHGIWDPATSNPRRLTPEPAGALLAFAERMLAD
ncbi:MAG: alpha/beta hydrolase [Planctomycetota bacterium]|nr:alpha/beta hydrolase [Planctomycetota bacterium]